MRLVTHLPCKSLRADVLLGPDFRLSTTNCVQQSSKSNTLGERDVRAMVKSFLKTSQDYMMPQEKAC